MTAPNVAKEDRFLGDLGPRIYRFGLMGGVAGLGLAVLVWTMGDMEARRFLRGYLVGFLFVLSLCLGGLFFTMLQHLTRAGWSVVVRRVAEGLASNLKWIWILFIPVLIPVLLGMHKSHPYEWTEPDVISATKAAYLNPTFWTIRAILYFGIWAALARYFVGRSMDQDETGDPAITSRMQAMAAPGMILYALTQSFAAIDWVMSLEPHWFSTMFGVYFFAASCCGFFAALILACMGLQRAGRVTASISTDHFHDMGKHLFAFGIAFWAYIAFSQYMLIWYANIPEETGWFASRQLGGWGFFALTLLLGHFLGPFVILISRWPKRTRGMLAAGAVWMLMMHYVDLYWITMPAVPSELVGSVETYEELVEAFHTRKVPGADLTYAQVYGPQLGLTDLLCVASMGCILVGMTARALRERPLIPVRDPRLAESLTFENY